MSSNLPQDTSDIVVPPFPFSEEEEKVVESKATDISVSKSKKGKGVNQSEVFTLQKSINGTPNPQSFRNFWKQWKCIINNYGERKDGKVHVKVDGNLLPIFNILFNDETEHSYLVDFCRVKSS